MAGGELTRSSQDRMVAGIAGGMAGYFGVDPVLVRVAWVVAAFFGFGLILYPLLWVVLPQGPVQTPAVRAAQGRYARGEIPVEQLNQILADLRGRSGVANTSALRTLEESYARGELSREEFLARREVLARPH
jgi:phage shock protein PspC (stress-responsive transcriptional regulator)